MTNYESMARIARENHDSFLEAQRKAREHAATAEIDRIKKARANLNVDLMPALDQAKREFERQGIQCSLNEAEVYSDFFNKKVWQVKFRCCQPGEIVGGKAGHTFCGAYAKFEHDGERINISGDDNKGGKHNFTSVEKAVEHALTSMFGEMRRL